MRILICGGRDYTDRKAFNCAMQAHMPKDVSLIVHGGARGADSLAQDWADEHGICCMVYEADWKKHGKAAGPIRNQLMADTKPDLCIALPGGRGTADMVRRAKAAGIPVLSVENPGQ